MISTGYYSTLSPAQGSYLSLKVDVSSGVKLNKTTSVTTADVDVKNGVIHVIDKVLLPPTVVDQALANDNFTILVQAVVKAGLVMSSTAQVPSRSSLRQMQHSRHCLQPSVYQVLLI